MKSALAIILILIFSVLALIHFYWASGGLWGFESALPTDENGVLMLNPKTYDSIIVGASLALFGSFYWITFISKKHELPLWLRNIGLWAIPIIFTLRAMGDFKFIGFFKQIKSTEFAKIDTLFFSPLCLTIAIIGFVLLSKRQQIPEKASST